MARFGTHYDTIPHGNCGDPTRCDCTCLGCWRDKEPASDEFPCPTCDGSGRQLDSRAGCFIKTKPCTGCNGMRFKVVPVSEVPI